MKIEKLKINIRLVLNLTILALMATLFVGHAIAQETSPPLSGNAIIFSGWMDYAEWFVIVTFFPSIIIMLFIALGLHIARPMVLRYLNRMTLRLGADILWEAWIIGRDVMILIAVALLGMFIIPRVQSDWNTGIYIPAFILGVITLLYKLITDTDADKTKYTIATVLTGLTFVAALIPFAAPPGYGVLSWEDRGHQHFVDEVLTPLSAYDMQQQQRMQQIITNRTANAEMINNIKSTINDVTNAVQNGDKSTALAKAQEADINQYQIGTGLKAWDGKKYLQIENGFNALQNAANNGDTTGVKTAQSAINQILDEYAKTL